MPSRGFTSNKLRGPLENAGCAVSEGQRSLTAGEENFKRAVE